MASLAGRVRGAAVRGYSMATVFVVGARGIPDCEGGAEKNAERLFPLIAARGWRVVLMGLKRNIHGTSFRGVELRGAPELAVLKTDKLLYYFTAVFAALRLKPDIVHLQGLGSAIMLWAYRLMGAKTVVRYGSADYLVAKWGLLGRLGFLAAEYQLRWADAVISVTPALADRLAKRGIRDNVHVIANALDDRDAFDATPLPAMPTGPYVLAVGRVTTQKNIDTLIRGFNLFAMKVPGVNLAIAGGLDDADYVAGLKPLLNERVTLLGKLARSSLGTLYAGACIYVNSSVHEGSSNAVLEAISLGCPILLSGIPENRDFGLPERNHFDESDPQAIADALARAFADPAAYRPDANRFLTWSGVADRTLAVYDQIVPPARRSAAARA